MTADVVLLPGETPGGRHRPDRLWPEGLTTQRLLARCGYAHRAVTHHHGADR